MHIVCVYVKTGLDDYYVCTETVGSLNCGCLELATSIISTIYGPLIANKYTPSDTLLIVTLYMYNDLETVTVRSTCLRVFWTI